MTSIGEQVVDWWVKGLQVSRCYKDDWDYINNIFKDYNLNLDSHSPIITINEVKNVKIADKLARKICNYPEFDDYRSGELFLVLLRAIPIFDRIYSNGAFERSVCGQKPPLLHKLLNINGTIKSTDKEFEQIIQKSFKIINVIIKR